MEKQLFTGVAYYGDYSSTFKDKFDKFYSQAEGFRHILFKRIRNLNI
jgi:hypothetical protein